MLLQTLKVKGFTLVELVTVIVLLSILSVAALSRLGGMSAFEEKAFFDEVFGHVKVCVIGWVADDFTKSAIFEIV